MKLQDLDKNIIEGLEHSLYWSFIFKESYQFLPFLFICSTFNPGGECWSSDEKEQGQQPKSRVHNDWLTD